MNLFSRGSLWHRLFRSILFHLLCFLAVVVLYNRLIYALHSISSRQDFSTWAAPLYAPEEPLPGFSIAVILRWSVPILIAGAWIWIAIRWMRDGTRSEPIVAGDASPRTLNRTLASPATIDRSTDHSARSSTFGSKLRIALGFVLALNITTCMMNAGVESIIGPFSRSGEESFGDAAHLRNPLELLRNYPTLRLSHHPRTHPPGGVLLLWIIRKTLGEGLLIASLTAIVLTALTLIPAAMLARRFLTDSAMTIFIALYVLTPNLVLFGATSMDGVFALVLVTTACAFFSAATPDLSRTILRGIVPGLCLALSTFFTYATIALVVLFVVWWILHKRPLRMLMLLATAAITLIACFALLYLTTGCNLIACARAAIAFDAESMADVKAHYWDVSFTNLLGFLAGSGVIAAALWLRSLRGRSQSATLARALGITILILSFSWLFTRELERVWMFLTPLLLIGASQTLDELQNRSLRLRWILATMILLFAQTWLTQALLNTIW